jgi:hypothetical protein
MMAIITVLRVMADSPSAQRSSSEPQRHDQEFTTWATSRDARQGALALLHTAGVGERAPAAIPERWWSAQNSASWRVFPDQRTARPVQAAPRGFERMGGAFSLAVKSLSAQRTSFRQQRHDQESISWAMTRDARRRALSSFIQQASASALLRPSLSIGGRRRAQNSASWRVFPDQRTV